MKQISIRNRQRIRRIDLPLLRRIFRHLVDRSFGWPQFELGLHLVEAPEMSRVNEHFLGHVGSTDVITFDYSDDAGPGGDRVTARVVSGEIYICLEEALIQARRFRTSWQSELVLYLIHGLLHLEGYSDLEPALRRVMKRKEKKLLRETEDLFPIEKLGRESGEARPAGWPGRRSASRAKPAPAYG